MVYHNSSWFTPIGDTEVLRVAREILSIEQTNKTTLNEFTIQRKRLEGQQDHQVKTIEIYQGHQKVFEVDDYETRVSVKGGWRHELKQELKHLNPEAILA